MANTRIQDQIDQHQYREYLWNQKEITSKSTVDSYYKNLKKLPYFNLYEDSIKTIQGRVVRHSEFKNSDNVVAIKKYIEYQFSQLRQDPDIPDSEIGDLIDKKNRLLNTIQLTKDKKNIEGTHYDTIEGEEHYIHKPDLLEFIRQLEPNRARFVALTYLLGTRWSGSKRIDPDKMLRPDEGDHGALRIPEERTKSKEPRTIEFHSPLPAKIIESSLHTTGQWSDDTRGREWKNVLYSEIDKDTLGYRFGKKVNGKLYGTLPDITGERKTIHSLRHTRVTDLVNNGFDVYYVQKRTGHSKYDTTEQYNETVVENPILLEQYLEKTGQDLIKAIETS